jgi:hypothetical protein
MPPVVPPKQVMLQFKSIAAISQFKKACACDDFYIDRDALTLVGSFTTEQVALAVEHYEAASIVMAE